MFDELIVDVIYDYVEVKLLFFCCECLELN